MEHVDREKVTPEDLLKRLPAPPTAAQRHDRADFRDEYEAMPPGESLDDVTLVDSSASERMGGGQ